MVDYNKTSDDVLTPRESAYKIRSVISKDLETLCKNDLDENEPESYFNVLEAYTEDRIRAIFLDGVSLERFCKLTKTPLGYFKMWMRANPVRMETLTEALEDGLQCTAKGVIGGAMKSNPLLDQEEKAAWDIQLKAAKIMRDENRDAKKKRDDGDNLVQVNIAIGSSTMDEATF